ncbi:aromatic ring-hydroxylating oxygenase subunit alpha [Planctomicrobium sp. SH664]|uniref:aromatic ring-hydroxylating oxygenase subunit alpha n=1 Tax=Planctomicrobium sp. SH664 TaxID=3448125 RepID=UPI003F5C281A
MYHSKTSLEPPLPPAAYSSPEHWQQEYAAVFSTSWHLVASGSELREPGQFVSLELLGVPVVLRNFAGEIVALRNVCAHRQCQIVSRSAGRSLRLACPYHGWEYGADGRTRKLPGASNFPHFDHRRYALDRFPVARCGELIFIRLSESGPSFEEWIGDRFPLFAEWFSLPEYRMARKFRFDYAVNWKIPVEGALESYHIPVVHPQTFVEDPGESRSEHFVHDNGTSFQTQFLTPRWLDRRLRDTERFMMHLMKKPFIETYSHHHVFPNLLISHVNSISVAQVVCPAGPTQSWSYAFHFSREAHGRGMVAGALTRLWGMFTPFVTKQILNEDVAIFPAVQRGTMAATRPGLLGRCEERLHALQTFVKKRIDSGVIVSGAAAEATTSPSSTATGCEHSDRCGTTE